MKKVNSFEIEKVQAQSLLSFCLIFRQFQSVVAYKSVAYKNSVYLNFLSQFKSM